MKSRIMKSRIMITVGAVLGSLILCGQVRAADPTGALYWSTEDIKNIEKALAPKVGESGAADNRLMMQKSHNVLFFHRIKDGVPEIHQKLADFMMVQGGEGAVLVGGKIGGEKPAGPDEIRGTALEGGMKYTLHAGDVLYIPANVPHRTLVEVGKHLDVMVIKVQP
jgi:mannose-6-phosphate isomerase-like protein (cupin superfamily)